MINLNELIKNNTVVVVDTETTGLCAGGDNVDKIYEISARKVVDREISSNALFLYRDDKFKIDSSIVGLSVSAFKVNGDVSVTEYSSVFSSSDDVPLLFVRDDKLILEASNIKSAVKKLKRFIGKDILCGYDLAVDLKFLNRYQAFGDLLTVDLLPIVKATVGDKVRNLKLNTVCEYFGIEVSKKSYVTLTAELLLKLADHNI